MAEDKGTFPQMPVKSWFILRQQFKNSIPPVITPTYLATVLKMNPQSSSNVLPSLRRVGIVDAENKPLDRAKQWRDDAQYKDVCASIRKEVYPQELSDAVMDPMNDRTAVESWFANKTGLGRVAVQKMVAFYLMLSKADPSDTMEAGLKDKPIITSVKKRESSSKKEKETPPRELEVDEKQFQISDKWIPSLHIDIQIHISPETSATQIEKIFESIATHLKQPKHG